MDKSKLNMRTRKVVDYAAMNGSDDDSDDDFINRNSKIPAAASKTQKPQKISKLKLGGRKAENNGSSKKDFTKVKPIIEQIPKIQLVASTSGLESIESLSDLSVAEPDLIAHSICSQDTVIISSCECASSQESTDFSDSASSTINLLTLEELPRSTAEAAPVIIKPLLKENRVAKKRIIDETLFTNKNVKKTKIEKKEEQKLKKESSPKTANVLPPVIVSPCMVIMDKLPHSQLIATPTKVKENSPRIPDEVKNQPKVVYNKKPAADRKEKGKLKTRKAEFVDEPPVKNDGNVETLPENDHNNFKSPMSPIAKKPAKWNPPGKASAGSTTMTSTAAGNSPAIGLRLGLSRNKRLAKPLHPEVKVKI